MIGHMCAYGLVTSGPDGVNILAMKATRWMSNCPELLEALSQKCPKTHEHQMLRGSRARQAAIYTEEVQDAICTGLKTAIRRSASSSEAEY